MSTEKDYKDTINLPKTDFPMKADLATREPLAIEAWKQNQIYKKMIERRKGFPLFTMTDGPPYANGGIHMGHTLNKCLKDITLKFQNLNKKKAVFIPGWDCHGLPIEHKVLKDLGDKSKDASAKTIRDLCRKEALKWVEHQKIQFQRLGILADWDHPYLTLASDYEAEEVREIARILKNGVLYRGQKPVYWCYALQTALAEAEIEYAPHKSPSVYVKFPFQASKKFSQLPTNTSFVIWTTTPWTLPSNVAIALNKDFDYTVFSTGNEQLIIARQLKEFFEKETGLSLTDTGKTFKGSEFEFEKAKHPFYDRESLLILGDHVTAETGTGAVHTAPGHGQEDYIVGVHYKLPVLSPVNERGEFTSEVPEYAGTHVFKANPLIVERMKENGSLLATKIIEHSYPHCWRSKTPLIFRATSQWFIRMDDKNFNIREKAREAINHLLFVPDWGVKRLTAMIEARPDWCISRQRNWGVPIPVFYCESCGHVHLTEKTIFHVADLMEKNQGIEAYFESPTETLLGDEQKCTQCGQTQWKKGVDILDVWFDSGSCHAAVQKKRDGAEFPCDLYLEGSDQHRGWFQTSLLASIASTGQAPFRALFTHNFVNDEHGRKMSKSLGNYVDPMNLIQTSGAELLRLWTASQDYGQDMNFSQEGFKRISETYRKYRNTFRFLVGNLHDFNQAKDSVNYNDLLPIDKWALTKLNELIETTQTAYGRFEYFKVYHALNNYFTVDLSAHYLDLLKDRLYTWKTNGRGRRSAQTVLFEITKALLSIMAPITSFLSEETYGYFVGKNCESVFLTDFPEAQKQWSSPELQSEFELLFQWRANVSKQLEELRRDKVIGSSLEAQIILTAKNRDYEILKKYERELTEFFIVSSVVLEQGEVSIRTEKAPGEKCPRCWYISEKLGTSPVHPTVCPKCTEALT